jgi:PEP-CTERM motif
LNGQNFADHFVTAFKKAEISSLPSVRRLHLCLCQEFCRILCGICEETELKTKVLLLVLVLVVGVSGTLKADTIPYDGIGSQAPSFTFTALNSGLVTAYFYNSDAGYTSVIGMSVKGGVVGPLGLNNQTSVHGQSFDLGNVNAGDVITFSLFVYDLNHAWSSDVAQNADGLNHVFATNFSGDSMIPVGTYLGFEDLYGGGDLDYNDHQFVVTNVAATAVPEPATLSLLGAGTIFAGALRKKLRK